MWRDCTLSDSAVAIRVPVSLGARSYEILIGSRGLADCAITLTGWLNSRPEYQSRTRSALIVTDVHVAGRHAQVVCDALTRDGWRCGLATLPAGEHTKSLEVVADLYDRLVALRADRQTAVVAVGGGVIGDVAGFAAATYARGLPFLQIPTTLLAQVDSSVGGKVGINHPQGKNLIGAFHQPQGVLIDTSVLATLPDRDYRSGLAEVVKYGVILDAGFFEYLAGRVAEVNTRDPGVLRDAIATSCRLKAQVVEQDEYERSGLRAVLNYGHTFAHAFEALAGYEELLHGEAVAIGMVCAARLAERLGRVPADLPRRQSEWLAAVGLPTRLPERLQLRTDALIDRMQLDKKSVGGNLRFVLPTRLGHVELVPHVPLSHVQAVLHEAGAG